MNQKQFTEFLKNVTSADFSLAGGKGANLGEMIKAGLPVPQGFVLLTRAYQRFVADNSLQPRLDNLLLGVQGDSFKELERASQDIQALFHQGEISEDVWQEMEKAYELLGMPAVAVRSSATAEDLPGTSFAGQYDTYLNIKGKEELARYVKKCWASLWNHRALSYRLKHNIGHHQLAIAVVVQKLIDAEKSGILFTANPLNGRRDQVLLNSSWGLGEAVVGGEVNPDQWVIDKQSGSIMEERIARKEVMTVREARGIELVNVPPEKQEEITLDQGELEALLQLALKVEDYFGSPQDLEWASNEGTLYLVQTRPITSLYPMPEVKGRKNGMRVYINVNNYSQAMKEPFTPMGADVISSMIKHMLNKLGPGNIKGDPLWWLQNLGGRLFVDITDFMRTEKSWDKFKKEDPNDKDPITTRALLQLIERNRDEIINPKEAVKLYRMLNPRLIKFMAGAAGKYSYGVFSPITARKKAINLGDQTVREMEEARKHIQTTEEKLRFIEDHLGKLFINCFELLFYVSVSSTYIEKARKIMKTQLDDISDLQLVEKSVPHSVTTEMGMHILELAKGYDQKGKRPGAGDPEVKAFLAKYGHRSAIELDVGVPSWQEEPQYVLDLINSYIDNKNYQEGIDRFYSGKKEAEKAIQRIKTDLEKKGERRKAKKVEKILKDFREMFGIRELSKFVVTQVFSITRDLLIEVGEELERAGRISDKMDIFFVTIEDIRAGKDLNQRVKRNKEQFLIDEKRVAPRLLTSTGESIFSAMEEAGDLGLTGIPVSPGVFEGPVRVLDHPQEGYKLEQGDILVTTGTNPAWTPLFLKLGALIMETGGSISHGSVVAREYGVPAVAGVSRATTELKDGYIVRINGETGSVDVIDRSCIKV